MSLMICTPQKTNRQSAPGEVARRLGLHKNCLGREVSFWKQVALSRKSNTRFYSYTKSINVTKQKASRWLDFLSLALDNLFITFSCNQRI